MTLIRSSTGLIFEDDFNRADGDPGADYSVPFGGATYAIVSNQLRITGNNAESRVRVDSVSTRSEWFVQATMTRLDSGVDAGVMGGENGTGPIGSGYLFQLIDAGATGTQLWKIDSGYTNLANAAHAVALSTPFISQLYHINSEQKGWLDGTLKTSGTSASTLTGYPAIRNASNAGRVDVDGIVCCTTRYITVAGLPSGWKAKVDAGSAVVESGGTATIDLGGATLPAGTVYVLDGSDVQQESVTPGDGVWGGDAYLSGGGTGEVNRATQAGLIALGATDTDIRATQAGLIVLAVPSLVSPIRVTQAGVIAIGVSAYPTAPELEVIPSQSAFIANTSDFRPSSALPADVHLSTIFEVTDTGDPLFAAVLFTFQYDDPSPYLLSAILDGLGAPVTYLVRAQHVGTVGGSPWSLVVESTTLVGAVPNAPTVTVLETGVDFVTAQGSAFSHPDGPTTTRENYNPLAPLPYLEFSEFRIRLTSTAVVVLDTGPQVLPVDATYGSLFAEDLLVNTAYQIQARYWDGDQKSVSAWGAWVDFSTDAVPPVRPDAPAVTVDVCNPGEVTLSGAAFNHALPAATHAATRWRYTFTSDGSSASIITTNPAELTAYIFEGLPAGAWDFDAQYQDSFGNWSDWGTDDACTQLAFPVLPSFLAAGGVRLCVASLIEWNADDGTTGYWLYDGEISSDDGATWSRLFSGSLTESYFFTFSGRPDGAYLLRVRAGHPAVTYVGDWSYLVVRVDRTCDAVVHYDFSGYSALDPGWELLWNEDYDWHFIDSQGEAGGGFALLAKFPDSSDADAVDTSCLVFPELGEPVTCEIEIEFFIFGEEANSHWYRWIDSDKVQAGIAYSVSGTKALGTQVGFTTRVRQNYFTRNPEFGGVCPYGDCLNPCGQATGCQCLSAVGDVQWYRHLWPDQLWRYGVASDMPYYDSALKKSHALPLPPWRDNSGTIPYAGDKIRGMEMVTRRSVGGTYPVGGATCDYHSHPKYTMRQKVTRTVTGGARVQTQVIGPGLDPTQGWSGDEEIGYDYLQAIQCGGVGLAAQVFWRTLDPVKGIAFTGFTISNREYDTCQPPPGFVPPPPGPVAPGDLAGRPCAVILNVYEEDRETIRWQVGDYRDHANPYLCLLENYGEQEVDVVSGAVTIGQVEVVLVDRHKTPGDQDSGWMTERLSGGDVGRIHGRRCQVIRFISEALGWVVIADGPASAPMMDETYAAYRWVVRDTRETERKVRAFVEASTSWLLPMGVEPGFGAYEDEDGAEQWLVEPATPLVGVYSYDALDPYPVGTVNFTSYWSGPFGIGGAPIGDQVVDEAVVITAPVEAAMLADSEELGDPRPVLWTWPNLEIVWRIQGSADPWTLVDPTDLLVTGRSTAKPTGAGQWWRSLITPWDAETADGTVVRGALYMTLRGYQASGTFPTDGDTIEIAVRYTGEPTEDFPLHIEGMTSGEFLKQLYDGEYSPRNPITGAVVPTKILYNETDLLRMGGGVAFVSLGTGLGSIQLAGSTGRLLLTTSPSAVDRVLLRQTEVVDDLRAWTEPHVYSPTGWFASLDNDGEISPRNQVPPLTFEGLLQITNAVTEPQPDWDAGETIVNVLTYEYPRWVPVDVGEVTAIDRLEERPVTIEYRDEASVTRHGIQSATYDGDVFSAIGDAYGKPIVAFTAEQGKALTELRRLYVFDRYRNAAPALQVPVMRRYCSQIRAGDWVVVDLSWFPDYATQKRGLITGCQVLAVYDVDCAWRILLLEEAFPIVEES